MSEKPSLGARAIVVKNNNILLVKHQDKRHDKQGEFFLLPGGGVDSGESILEAAARETIEETSIKVKPIKIAYIRETKWQDQTGVEFFVYCEYISGDANLGTDPEKQGQVLEEVIWLPLEELSNITMHPKSVQESLVHDIETGFAEVEYLGVEVVG